MRKKIRVFLWMICICFLAAGFGQSISVNAAAAKLSADNSLEVLSLSAGTLSPEFTGKTISYSATVPNDVTSVTVTATPVNEFASVESVTGNDSLKEGANEIKVVVKAQNGATATYTITVTREAAGAAVSESAENVEEQVTPVEGASGDVTINEEAYQFSDGFSAEQIPADFTESSINYQGTEYKGLSFSKGSMSLAYLVPAGGDASSGSFYIYDETTAAFYPFVKITHGEKYVIWLPTPADYVVPEGYQEAEVVVGGTTSMPVYQQTAESTQDFSIFYATNQDGIADWYQYDAAEGTYQRQNALVTAVEESDDSSMEYLQEEYNNLSEEFLSEKAFSRNTISILVFVVVVLIIVIINILLHRHEKDEDIFPENDEPAEDVTEKKNNENLEEIPEKSVKIQKMTSFFAKRMIDDLEEDEYEENIQKKAFKKEAAEEETAEEEPIIAETVVESTPTEKDDLEVLDLNDL